MLKGNNTKKQHAKKQQLKKYHAKKHKQKSNISKNANARYYCCSNSRINVFYFYIPFYMLVKTGLKCVTVTSNKAKFSVFQFPLLKSSTVLYFETMTSQKHLLQNISMKST